MVNYKKIVLKGDCKEECPSGQRNNFPLCFNKVFIDLEAFHFWPSEGSENGELHKDSPQRRLQREVPKLPKITFPFVLIRFLWILRHFIFLAI